VVDRHWPDVGERRWHCDRRSCYTTEETTGGEPVGSAMVAEIFILFGRAQFNFGCAKLKVLTGFNC
jgi:hypothetical protein